MMYVQCSYSDQVHVHAPSLTFMNRDHSENPYGLLIFSIDNKKRPEQILIDSLQAIRRCLERTNYAIFMWTRIPYVTTSQSEPRYIRARCEAQ